MRLIRNSTWLAGLLAVNGCADDVTATPPADGTGSTGTVDDGARTGTTGTDDEDTDDEGVDDTGDAADDTGTTGSLPDIEPEQAEPGLAASFGTTCEVSADGELWCWGLGGCGIIPDGTHTSIPPARVATDLTWGSVSLGESHGCGITDEQRLWCWGDGEAGRVGDGVLTDIFDEGNCRLNPVAVAPEATWARVSAGGEHTCGLQSDGTAWCWGSNAAGQIGDGSVGGAYTRIEPVAVVGDRWVDIVAGDEHTCALRSDETLWCWGRAPALGIETAAFTSIPTLVDFARPVTALGRGDASGRMCVINDESQAWCWGDGLAGGIGNGSERDAPAPVKVDLEPRVTAISLSGATTCAQLDDATLWCWGSGSSGQLGDGIDAQGHHEPRPVIVEAWSEVADFAVGASHVCANDGSATRCMGSNFAGQVGDGTSGPDNGRLTPAEVGPFGGGPVATGWDSVALGTGHACGTRDDALWCWGQFGSGQLGVGPVETCAANPTTCASTTPRSVPTPASTSLALGSRHTCGLDGGALWCWGANESGQLGLGTKEGTQDPTQVGADTDWLGVAAGSRSTCGLRAPGSLWCWGENALGALGLGDVDGPSSPTQVGIELDWSEIATGAGNHTCGLRGDALYCWGWNLFDQLGLGSAADDQVSIPSPVPGSWAAVAVGSASTCGIRSDGSLWCWGSNADGILGTDDDADTVAMPSQVGTDSDWSSVTVGDGSICARRNAGTLWCWGSHQGGATGLGETEGVATAPTQVGEADDWVSVAASGRTTCGVRADGIAWCWGANGSGQQGNDTTFEGATPREVRDDG